MYYGPLPPGAPPPGYGAPPAGFTSAARPPPPAAKPPGWDAEAAAAAAGAAAFAETAVRSAFVRKVFVLVFLQLAVTIGVAAVFLFVDPVNAYVAGEEVYSPAGCNERAGASAALPAATCTYLGRAAAPGEWLLWTSFALVFVTLVAMACSSTLRRRFPANVISLVWFTGVLSLMVGCIVARWEVDGESSCALGRPVEAENAPGNQPTNQPTP
jgi:hypothetical protein